VNTADDWFIADSWQRRDFDLVEWRDAVAYRKHRQRRQRAACR